MVAAGGREAVGVRRERKEKLTAAELRAMGTTPDLVTRRLRLTSLDRGNRPQPTKDERESKRSLSRRGGEGRG